LKNSFLNYQLNAGRHELFLEECKYLRKLPARRLEDFKEETQRVSKNSTIIVNHEVDLENYDLLLSGHPNHITLWDWDEIYPLSKKANAGAGGAL
jgi:hypothetical protein